ncbi:hypothetical protein [Blautia faecicola]|uniref:Uncharacterized protein n=1 Tax=Blautia faecicola TaxID=2509240 RepID=A0A4Q1RKP7_9FIRM|nr:hypothetical protein [Blautia faecicola]RXS76343.1 hypothetical protein ETP43_14810 [Blautia faecicola]
MDRKLSVKKGRIWKKRGRENGEKTAKKRAKKIFEKISKKHLHFSEGCYIIHLVAERYRNKKHSTIS